jgi:hypothetical protein
MPWCKDVNTLVKGKIPDWVAEMFKKVDGKELEAASAYFTEDCDFYFGHFHLIPGPAGILKFMGAFDDQLPEYHHLIDEVWAGPALVEFGGRVQFKIDDGTWVETPSTSMFKTGMRALLLATVRVTCDRSQKQRLVRK